MVQASNFIRTLYLYFFALVGLMALVIGAVNLSAAALDRYVWPQEFVQYDYTKPASSVPCVDAKACAVTGGLTVEQQKEQFIAQQNNQFKSRTNSSLPAVIIGWGLWWFHWAWIKRDRKHEI